MHHLGNSQTAFSAYFILIRSLCRCSARTISFPQTLDKMTTILSQIYIEYQRVQRPACSAARLCRHLPVPLPACAATCSFGHLHSLIPLLACPATRGCSSHHLFARPAVFLPSQSLPPRLFGSASRQHTVHLSRCCCASFLLAPLLSFCTIAHSIRRVLAFLSPPLGCFSVSCRPSISPCACV